MTYKNLMRVSLALLFLPYEPFFIFPIIPKKFNIAKLSNTHKVTNNWPYAILNSPVPTLKM